MAIDIHRVDEIYGHHQTPAPRTDRVQGGEIVCTAGDGGDCAMSARRILGGQYLPRVGLFAH
jgi:hypothetical protein